MAQDVSRSVYQGLGIPDPRLATSDALWSAESTSLEQADPKAGVPTPSQTTSLVLTSGGSQAAGSSVDVRCNRGGLTGPDQGGFVWRNTGDTDWYGHDHAAALSYAESIQWGTTSTNDHYSVDVTADADGNVYIAAARSGPASTRQVVVYKIDGSTGAKTTATVASGLTTAFDPYAAICYMPDGSLQVWYWVEGGANACQIRVARSTDDGVTWTTTATGALDVPVDISGSPGAGADGYDVGRIRVAAGNGQTMLVARLIAHNTTPTYREVTLQAAGPGNGEALKVITTTDGSEVWGWPDVVFALGRFYVVRQPLPADAKLNVYSTGNAFTDVTSLTEVAEIQSGGFNLGELDGTAQYVEVAQCEIWVDDTGALYVMGQMIEGSSPEYATAIGRSTDAGVSWQAMGSYPSPTSGTQQMAICFNLDDTGTRLDLIAAHWATGRCLMPFTHVSSGTSTDDSLAIAYVGGYSTVTLPGLDQFAADDRRSSWYLNGLPLDLPGATQWTANTSGTASEAISTSAMRLDLSTTTGTQWYSIAPPNITAITQPITAVFALQVDSGGSLSTTDCGIRMQLSDGTDRYQIAINATTTGFRVRDLIAPSDLVDVSVDMTTPREILVGMVAGKVSVWYRQWTGAANRQWTSALDDQSLSTTTGVSVNNIQWGHINSATATSKWYRWAFVDGSLSGLGLAEGQTNPDDILPRYWAGPPFANELPAGLKITASRGPGRYGDEWVIATRYGFGVDQAFFGESPAKRDTWRSTTTGAQSLALQAFGSSTVDNLSDTILLGGANTNFSDFDLQGYNGSSWQTLASFDTSISIPGGAVNGNTFSPTGTSTVYVQANEFAGSTLKIGTAYRRIVRHSGGMLGSSTGSRVAVFELEGMTGSETVSNPAIIPKDWVVRYERSGSKYQGLRISIASQATAEGYFQAKFIPARMEVFGVQPAYGWTETTRTNVGRDRSSSGVVRTRKRGDEARTFTYAWTDGVYEAQVQGASGLSPDFLLTYDNGQVNGVRFDTAYQMRGILSEMDGPSKVGILLRRIEQLIDPTRTAVYNRRGQFAFIRFDDEVSIENIRGEEFSNEFVRVAQVTVDEVV